LIKVLFGNSFEKVKDLEDNSIDCVVSSPPYFGLRDYGNENQMGLENHYKDYIQNTVNLFRLMKPKLKDTATIWWNVGDTYAMSSMRGKDSLFRSIDQSKSGITTVKRSIPIGLKAKDLMMIPNRVAIALQDAGWYIRSEIIWHKPNPMPESVKDRPTSAHEKIWLITKSKKYYYDAESIKEHASGRITGNKKPQKGTDQRFSETKQGLLKAQQKPYYLKNKRNVWTVTTKPFKGAHFATFPIDLIEPCVLAGCPEGGTVLDPFGGSGTTGVAAHRHKRNAVLIELNREYKEVMKLRFSKEGSLLLQVQYE
jgi:DNA modification methylase